MMSEQTKQYRLSRIHAKKKRVQRVSHKEWDEYHAMMRSLDGDPQLFSQNVFDQLKDSDGIIRTRLKEQEHD